MSVRSRSAGNTISGACGIAVLSAALAGCDITGAWGPDPVIQPQNFGTAITGQMAVLHYITTETGLGDYPNQPLSPAVWYPVAEWGFNVGRQDCEVYLDQLFRMSREKQRNDSILAGLSTASAAIVAATTKSQEPLSILAAAFGLSTALNDAVFQSYLFTEAPGLIANKVKQLQDTYRQTVEAHPELVVTPEAAYNAIQGYYHICLPHSIEGTVLQAVADTQPVNPGAATPRVLRTSVRPMLGAAPAVVVAPAPSGASLNSTPVLVPR